MQSALQTFVFYDEHLRAFLKKNKDKKQLYSRGIELLPFLSARFPYLSEQRWQELIGLKRIKINHQEASADQILAHKDVISYERKQEEEPPVIKDYQVIYQDDSIVAIEKGWNLPVSQSGRYWFNTLIAFLHQDHGFEKLYPVHRIDKETSGLLVVAKSLEAANFLGKVFAEKGHDKYYYAILEGELKDAEYWVEQPIGKDPSRSSVHIRQFCHPEGKKALSRFDVLAVENGLSFVGIEIFTGRTHQIRVHAEYLKAPILGDKLYGKTDQAFLELIKHQGFPHSAKLGDLKRHFLHSAALSFPHLRGAFLSFISSPLRSFSSALPFELCFPTEHGRIEGLIEQKLAQFSQTAKNTLPSLGTSSVPF